MPYYKALTVYKCGLRRHFFELFSIGFAEFECAYQFDCEKYIALRFLAFLHYLDALAHRFRNLMAFRCYCNFLLEIG